MRSAIGHLLGLNTLMPAAPSSTSCPVGSDLTAADYAALESRWIDRALADRAGLRRVDSLTGGEVIGRKSGNYAGIIIPYHHPGSDHIRDYRLRRDHPDLEYDSAGNLKQRQKYLSPPGRSNMLYLRAGRQPTVSARRIAPDRDHRGRVQNTRLMAPGESRLAAPPRFLPLGVSGVYNWRGTIGKTVGPDGSRLDVKGPSRISTGLPGKVVAS